MGIGDEVVIIGLFTSHYGVDHNVPIVRIGNIAAIQDEPVKTKYCGYMDAHLIEARSIGGLSGSPVFLLRPPVSVQMQKSSSPGHLLGQAGFTSGQALFLLGLVHGHFDVDAVGDVVSEDASTGNSINTGIGVVVPVEKIIETINDPDWVAERTRLNLEQRNIGGGAVADIESLPPSAVTNRDEKYSPEESERRFEAALRGARLAEPQPMKAIPPKRPGKAKNADRKKRPASES